MTQSRNRLEFEGKLSAALDDWTTDQLILQVVDLVCALGLIFLIHCAMQDVWPWPLLTWAAATSASSSDLRHHLLLSL